MYAILFAGGKQYRISEGEKILVNKLNKEVGEEVVFDNILMIRDKEKTTVGTPVVKDARVLAEVLAQKRSPKVIIFKKHAKKGYKKLQGHRQDITELKITKIEIPQK